MKKLFLLLLPCSTLALLKHTVNVRESRLFGSSNAFLHLTEYLNDDFSHIFGYNDPNHQISRLQEITIARIDEVIRNKSPIDTVKLYCL